MTPALTDADREAIAAIESNWALLPADLSEAGAGYLAGLVAGMERAAKVCDEWAERALSKQDGRFEAVDTRLRMMALGPQDCAAAIREQAKDAT